MKPSIIILIATAAIFITGCNPAEESASSKEIDAPMDEMQINSARRQCVNVAFMQGVPKEAAQEICGCTIDKLASEKKMTAEKSPSDEEQQIALNFCIDEHSKPKATQ